MTNKPTYEELEQRVNSLEKITSIKKQLKMELHKSEEKLPEITEK